MKTEKEPKVLKEEYVEYIPEIIPVNVESYQQEYLYGKSIEALDYNTQIRNKPTGGSPFIGYTTITGTGSKVVAGVGFTPSMVTFVYTDQAGGSGTGSMTTLSQFAHDAVSGSSVQNECIYLRDSVSTAVCRAARTSLDVDGFTINVTTATGINKIDYIAFP